MTCMYEKNHSIISHVERGFLGNFISTQKCLHSCVQMRLSKRTHVCIMSPCVCIKVEILVAFWASSTCSKCCVRIIPSARRDNNVNHEILRTGCICTLDVRHFQFTRRLSFFLPGTKIMTRIGLSKYFRYPVNCTCYEQLHAEWLVIGMCVLWPQTVASPTAVARILSWNLILMFHGMSKIRKFKSYTRKAGTSSVRVG